MTISFCLPFGGHRNLAQFQCRVFTACPQEYYSLMAQPRADIQGGSVLWWALPTACAQLGRLTQRSTSNLSKTVILGPPVSLNDCSLKKHSRERGRGYTVLSDPALEVIQRVDCTPSAHYRKALEATKMRGMARRLYLLRKTCVKRMRACSECLERGVPLNQP